MAKELALPKRAKLGRVGTERSIEEVGEDVIVAKCRRL